MDLSWMLASSLMAGATTSNTTLLVTTSPGASSSRRIGERPLQKADDALQDLQDLTQQAQDLAEEASDEDLSDTERDDLADQIESIEAEINELVEGTTYAFNPLLDGTGDAITLQRGDRSRIVDLGDMSLGGADSLDDAEDFAQRADEYDDYLDDLRDARDAIDEGQEFLDEPTSVTTVQFLPSPSVQSLLAQTVNQISQYGTLSLGQQNLFSIVVK